MARRVHQVQHIGLAVLGRIFQPHGLRLDGNAALLLDIHVIEHLLGHLARGEPAAMLDQPVGQGRFAMVDMRDNRKIADQFERCASHARDIRRNARRVMGLLRGAAVERPGALPLDPLGPEAPDPHSFKN